MNTRLFRVVLRLLAIVIPVMIAFGGCRDTGEGTNPLLAFLVSGGESLGTPLNVTATDATHNDRVTITWDAVAGATHYRVYRSDAGEGDYSLVEDLIAGTAYDDTGATPGVDWYYRVSACASSSEGGMSDPDPGAIGTFPNAPSSADATQSDSTTSVVVTWNAPSGGPAHTHYRIYRSDASDGTYVELDDGLTAAEYDDGDTSDGVHYYYRVTAYNAGGESAASNTCEGYWTSGGILAAPANVSATDRACATTVTVSWDAVTGSDYYRVFRSLQAEGTYVQVSGDVTLTNFEDTDTFEDTAFFYKVRAYDTTRESVFSAYDEGRCELTHLEYLLRFNINWEYMYTKLYNDTDFPPSSLGTTNYTVNGSTSGHIDVSVTASLVSLIPFKARAVTTFGWDNYLDFGMTINGTETTDCDQNGTGTHTGTVTTSASYTGTIVEDLVTTSKIRTGGTFYVTYNGTDETIDFASTWGPGIILSAPSHVMATEGSQSGKVVVTWAPVYGANKYRVYRSTTSGGSSAQVGTDIAGNPGAPDGTVYSFEDNTGNDTHYFYTVRAFNDYVMNDTNGDGTHQSGETPWSDYSAEAEGWGQ